MTGKQVKAMAFAREKRKNRTSPATRLKVARKNKRLRQRTIERKFARKQKERMDADFCVGLPDVYVERSGRYY